MHTVCICIYIKTIYIYCLLNILTDRLQASVRDCFHKHKKGDLDINWHVAVERKYNI